ncbi:MAG: hypothetical protein JW780_06775, partial [Clostridiales bacterium]|nr:hypothetical protein [Clostridiales bacterium]
MKKRDKNFVIIIQNVVSVGWLLINILYCEIVFALLLQRPPGVYTIGFSICTASLLTFLVYLIRNKSARFIVMGSVSFVITFLFVAQLIYFRIANTLFIIQLLSLAADATFFMDVANKEIASNVWGIILLLLPTAVYFVFIRMTMKRGAANKKMMITLAAIFIASGTLTTSLVLVDKSGAISPRNLILSEFLHEQSVDQFGLLTATGLDIRYNLMGIRFEDESESKIEDVIIEDQFSPTDATEVPEQTDPSPTDPGTPTEPEESRPVEIDTGPNVMDIEFDLNETDSE